MFGNDLGKRFKVIFGLFVSIIIAFCVLTANLMNVGTEYAFAKQINTAYAVFDVDKNEKIFGENDSLRLPMASTTKIMTALLVLENEFLDKKVKITKESVGVEGSSVYLKENEVLTVEDLLYCLMLRSGNDSAVALALSVAGSVDHFAEMMNIRAESLDLTNTHFTNPHGLHDENHYTSANDLGIIAVTAMKNPDFRKIVGTKQIRIGENESVRVLKNKNKMLNLFDGANGIKTGYTKKSGRCLVSSASRNGKTLVCVVLNYGDTYGLSKELLEKGFMMTEGT